MSTERHQIGSSAVRPQTRPASHLEHAFAGNPFRAGPSNVAVSFAVGRSIPLSPNVHALHGPKARPQDEKPSRTEVEATVRTIIRWTGEDPDRDGLLETPARVTRSFDEFFSGYGQDPREILEKTFEEIE